MGVGEPYEHLGESPAVELTGKIMIVVIIIMFFVIVIAICLHLFTRNTNFWWRSPVPQSRSRRHRFVFSSGQGQEGGLDPAVLSSLPVLVFQAQDLEGLECAVCLSDVVDGEKARLLPKCNHGFHVACIDMWFQTHSTCPLCRNPVVSSQEEEYQISEAASASASASTSTYDFDDHHNITLVIDIPSEITSTSLSPSSIRFPEDDLNLKSPMTPRLRSLNRLFSRNARLNPSTPTSLDLQQPPSPSPHLT